MAIITDNLPAEYVPFSRLEFCGNALVNCRAPIRMKGQAPVLVGRAPEGLWVWLSMPKDKDMMEWIALVEKNEAKNSRITIHMSDAKLVVVSTFLDPLQPILHVTREDDVRATVHKLDLRHIGLRMYGDENNGLFFGSHTFRGNTFEGVATAFAVDG